MNEFANPAVNSLTSCLPPSARLNADERGGVIITHRRCSRLCGDEIESARCDVRVFSARSSVQRTAQIETSSSAAANEDISNRFKRQFLLR